MTTLPPCHRFPRVVGLAAGFGLACAALAATAGDAIILPDGFTIQGSKAGRERNPGGYSFEVLSDGPKIIVFSQHTRKGVKVEKDVPRPEMTAYKKLKPGVPPLKAPSYGEMKSSDFDEKWERTVTVRRPDGGGTHVVKQVITTLDPYGCYVASRTHHWSLAFHTAEMDPKTVRRLLGTHKDLAEEPGKPDPAKRVAIATFLKDAGWLDMARDELKKAHKDVPGDWPKEVADRAEKLRIDIDQADTRLALDEADAAVSSGRYDYARTLIAALVPKAADPTDATRIALLKAQVDTVLPKYEETRRLLADLLHRASGGTATDGFGSVGGGPGSAVAPRGKPLPAAAGLIDAGRAVLAELHPSSIDRIDLFTNLARQADRRRQDGKEPGTGPAELLALAVTGWLKGKNGADPTPAAAGRCWATREMALAYLREPAQNERRGLLDAYLKAGTALPPDELAQVISLLPPPFAEDLAKPLGKEAPKAAANGVGGVYLRTAPGPNPASYYLRLPPGYHHGRSYPLMLLFTHTTIPAETMVGLVAPFADKFGYILAAPVWANTFSGPYDWSGDLHPMATAVLRDVLRKFQADPDRVFPFGMAEGANFAFDLGASHPDLFAGVAALGPTPQPDLFMHYWRNAQFLPFFVVTGQMAGDSPAQLRKVFEKWMPRGFPALLTQYNGRGVEWYAMELPRIFDWMSRKVRVRGTSALKLNNVVLEPWQIGRDGDDRFYWVGTTGVRPGYLLKDNVQRGWQSATLSADIRSGNEIVIRTLGLKDVVIWLEREMIDWTKPVRVIVNGQVPYHYTPKVMTPDLNLMFEELYRTGDRKVLMLGRLDFPTP